MPLVQATLASELQSAFDAYPESVADSAQALAGAYHTYASGAQFGASDVDLSGRDAALASTLQSGMTGTFAAFASAWSTGLTAYWTAATVTGAQAGATVPPPGAASVPAALAASFASYPESTADAADLLASALHTATATTTAAVSPPPGTILPIT